jgi:hypothetical protein
MGTEAAVETSASDLLFDCMQPGCDDAAPGKAPTTFQEKVMGMRDKKQERSRDFQSGPVWSFAEILKCAGCLAFLIGIAVVGATIDMPAETHGSAQAKSGSSAPHAAVVESRIGLDADRARLEGQSTALQTQSAR